MEDTNKVPNTDPSPATTVVAEPAGAQPATPAAPQTPVQKELEKVKAPKTEAEKAAFSLKMTAKRLRELGQDPNEILGASPAPAGESEDDAPVTVGMLKQREREQAQKTALDLADAEITNEHERELAKHHLANTIRPSGNPREDLRAALAIVNSVKNAQLVDVAQNGAGNRPTPAAAGGSAPGRQDKPFEPTPEEQTMMTMKGLDRKPLLTKEDILEARRKSEAAQK